MTCSACNLHKGGFSSEAVYSTFEERLLMATDKGDLIIVEGAQDDGPFLKSRYVCNKCGSCWQLIAPDQAFRGEWKEVPCN
ncbi:hypothetical protein WAE61_10745 [Comamonadaceae bacterium PP-2]